MLGDTNEPIVGNRNPPVASGGLCTRAEGVQSHQNLPVGMKERVRLPQPHTGSESLLYRSQTKVSASLPSPGQCCYTL